jgi:DNA polymerase-3 subunit gamma/tau
MTSAVEARDWFEVVAKLKLAGVAKMLAEHSVLIGRDEAGWTLCLDADHDTLLSDNAKGAIERAIGEHVGRPTRVTFRVGVPESETPARRKAREATDRQQRAIAALQADDNVRALVAEFDGELRLDTVRPVSPP